MGCWSLFIIKNRLQGGTMKKNIFLFLLLSAFVLNAHPPKSIDLSYDAAKATLMVKVWHNVGDSESHRISRITVFLGDEQIAEKLYQNKQQAPEYQEETFAFSVKPLKKGDLVKVKASCSRFGKKTVQLAWPE
jgi:hypothetical protein